MKKLLLIAGLFLFTGMYCQAQPDSGFIEVKHSIWGLRIEENAQRIKLKEATRRMEQVPEAYEVMKSARANYRQSQWLGVGAGIAVVYSLGSRHHTVAHQMGDHRISYNPVSAGIGIAGIGMAIIAFKMEKRSVRKMRDAASIYNRKSSGEKNDVKLSWRLTTHPTAIAVNLIF